MQNRITLTCACGRSHTLDATPDAGDPRGTLVVLSDGWGVLKPGTLRRWAREGRLPAFELERGRLASWEADIRSAVEMAPHIPVPRIGGTTALPANDPGLVALRAVGGSAA